MKSKILIQLVIILFQGINLFSQTIAYTYDANGNRISRTLIVEQLQSKSVFFPASENETLGLVEFNGNKETKDMKIKDVSTNDEEINVNVYPNPNKGILKIEISNLPPESRKQLRLYDLSGIELIVRKDFDRYTELNINNLKDGVYFLRINIDDVLFDFKVIKK